MTQSHWRCPLTWAVDGVRTPSTTFEHLVVLDFETVPRVRTRSIAVDRRWRRRVTAVDGRNARFTDAMRTLLGRCKRREVFAARRGRVFFIVHWVREIRRFCQQNIDFLVVGDDRCSDPATDDGVPFNEAKTPAFNWKRCDRLLSHAKSHQTVVSAL